MSLASSSSESDNIQGLTNLTLDDHVVNCSKISTHHFEQTFQETPIFFLVTKLGSSLMIWIGGSDYRLTELAYSSKTKYDKGMPLTTQLITAGDSTSSAMATKLTKKLGKPVFISYNLPDTLDPSLLHSIQIRLLEEIEKYPSKF